MATGGKAKADPVVVKDKEEQDKKVSSAPTPGASSGTSKGWLGKTLIGRTPSLPSSLGKKKHSFFKVGIMFLALIANSTQAWIPTTTLALSLALPALLGKGLVGRSS